MKNMNDNETKIWAIIGLIVIIPIIALLISLPVWLLWNWLMPFIFGLKTISWFQALGLCILSGFLFKSSK